MNELGGEIMQQNLPDHKLYMIAQDNYRILQKYCVILEEEGYWEQPKEILHKSIHEILDLYVQSCLIYIAKQLQSPVSSRQLNLIITLTNQNLYLINAEEGVSEDSFVASKKIVDSPPILYQLLGLRDTNKDTGLCGLFFDAIINILLVMSYLSDAAVVIYMQILQSYCTKVSVFLRDKDNQTTMVDEKYLFRKVCVGELEHSNSRLIEAGEDFYRYLKTSLFYRDKKSDKSVSNSSQNHNMHIQNHNTQNNNIQNNNIQNHNTQNNNIQNNNLQNHNTQNNNTQNNNTQNSAQIGAPSSLEESSSNQESLLIDALRSQKLNELLSELNSLVGLHSVKQEITSLVNLIKVKKLRER